MQKLTYLIFTLALVLVTVWGCSKEEAPSPNVGELSLESYTLSVRRMVDGESQLKSIESSPSDGMAKNLIEMKKQSGSLIITLNIPANLATGNDPESLYLAITNTEDSEAPYKSETLKSYSTCLPANCIHMKAHSVVSYSVHAKPDRIYYESGRTLRQGFVHLVREGNMLAGELKGLQLIDKDKTHESIYLNGTFRADLGEDGLR